MASNYKKDDGGMEVDRIDLALLVAIGVLLVVVVVMLFSTTGWVWWIQTLDMRNWSGWTWCGIVAALAGIVAWFRIWPWKE